MTYADNQKIVEEYLTFHKITYKDLNKNHINNIVELLCLMPENENIREEQKNYIKDNMYKLYLIEQDFIKPNAE